MKKTIKLTALFLLSASGLAWGDAAIELQNRLSKVESLTAEYKQTVNDPQGKVIQQGAGKLQLKHPNLFRMDSQTPQENLIISDGKTLWFYDPFVEQVTANWVTEAVNNTPFILLTNNDKKYWQRYDIEQKVDTFTLTPKNKNSNIKQFHIRIDSHGVLRNFSTTERDGQTNLYFLEQIHNTPIAEEQFKFTLPKGVEFDDQRKK